MINTPAHVIIEIPEIYTPNDSIFPFLEVPYCLVEMMRDSSVGNICRKDRKVDDGHCRGCYSVFWRMFLSDSCSTNSR